MGHCQSQSCLAKAGAELLFSPSAVPALKLPLQAASHRKAPVGFQQRQSHVCSVKPPWSRRGSGGGWGCSSHGGNATQQH